ncbi:hypothetical protein X777_09077 [Ooceraea biroi]|uniref:Uncharacterized protein n=1 Tax=Ooceraea biroi TaxID=2015173 RepID=A0A026WAL2_OOCBI|nr:hypothetical protein X777_09077 [Ooceraea biroi]
MKLGCQKHSDAPVYHCYQTVRDMQEMISTVKLDDRATAACSSKNGRYELPWLSTSVKDNLWPNKSVTRSPAIPPFSLSLSLSHSLTFGIKISAHSSLNLSTLSSFARVISVTANRELYLRQTEISLS